MSHQDMSYGTGQGRIYARGAEDDHFRIHQRPDYTPEETQQVVDWLNGRDQPLPAMLYSGSDPSYYGDPLPYGGTLVRDFPPLPSEL